MLALVSASGAPEHIELREVPDPQPAKSDALVEVRAVSLNRGEMNRLIGAEDGLIWGWDLSGVVRQAAADGTGPTEGARVVSFVPRGAWAQQVAVPAARLAELPEGVSFAAASTLPVAGLTALRTLRYGGLLAGKRVLITGAAGGVGRFAVQIAAQADARVTGVAGNPERAAGLRDLGAVEVVTDIEQASGPFDLILESVGGSSLAAALRLIGSRGTVVNFGNSAKEQTTFDVRDFYLHGATLVGFILLAAWEQYGVGEDLAILLRLMAAGRLDPQIGVERGWRDVAEALAALRDRQVQGKAILHVD